MDDIFFNQIIRYIPIKKRKDIRSEFSFYKDRINSEYSKDSNSFKITLEMMLLLVQVSFLIREVIIPLENAQSFKSRLSKFDINTIQSGSLIFGNSESNKIASLLEKFSKIMSFLHYDYKITKNYHALTFEKIDDFLELWKKEKS